MPIVSTRAPPQTFKVGKLSLPGCSCRQYCLLSVRREGWLSCKGGGTRKDLRLCKRREIQEINNYTLVVMRVVVLAVVERLSPHRGSKGKKRDDSSSSLHNHNNSSIDGSMTTNHH